MRLIITGSRDWADRWAVWRALEDAYAASGPFVVVHGGCPSGADVAANDWALLRKFPLEVFRADWRTHGRWAGPRRNQQMIEAGADLVLAFSRNGSAGTRDTVTRAREAGIEVRLTEVND